MVQQDRAQLMRDHNLTEGMLKVKCSKDHRLEIGTFISWKEVGARLPEIEQRHLDDIDTDGRNEADKRQKLVNLWEENNADDATYYAMITAMLRAERKAEATQVCTLLVQG